MLRMRNRPLSCHYCGKRSDIYFDPAVRQFDCKTCLATNHLDANGEITNPPLATVNAAPATIPKYTPNPNFLPPTSPAPPPETIFCDACLKHQRLFVASLAQYESESNKDDFELGKDYYRYRRGLVDRYPQCCDQCKPRVEAAIKKADYQAKTDYMRNNLERSRNPRNWRKKRTGGDYVHLMGWAVWWAALVLQLVWHGKMLGGVAVTSADGMRDPDDESWTTQGLQSVNEGSGYLPEGNTLIKWSLFASLASCWWNPKLPQVIRGFDKHLVGIKQWYTFQVILCLMRLSHFYQLIAIDQQTRNAQLAAHIIAAFMAVLVTFFATNTIKTDTTPLFGTHKGQPQPTGLPPTPKPEDAIKEGFTFWKQPPPQPTMAEALSSALPRSNEPKSQRLGSDDSAAGYGYQFLPAPKTFPSMPEQEDDMMEWQPTGSTTLPRALRNPAMGAGNRPFGEAPVQENSRPFWYRGPEAPSNPAAKARVGDKQPVMWNQQHRQTGFEHRALGGNMELQQNKFWAKRPGQPEDESLAGMFGKGLSFEEERDEDLKSKGWFGFGKK